jgi:hypothetical protein
MKKLSVLLLVVLLSPFIGAFYGVLHDQITYTISEEYYTKFKFVQFGLAEWGGGTNIGTANAPDIQLYNPRLGAAIVGALATWWVGLLIGIVLSLVGLLHRDAAAMFKVTLEAIAMTISIALVVGILGLLYGILFLGTAPAAWNLPMHVLERADFMAVGAMHNASYLGGLIGLIASVSYSLRARYRLPG